MESLRSFNPAAPCAMRKLSQPQTNITSLWFLQAYATSNINPTKFWRNEMNEVERILDQLKRAFEGNAWHGPAVEEVLADVTAEQAAAKPIPDAHSIWELTLHIA